MKRTDRQDTRRRPTVEWVTDRTIENDEYIVQINKLPLEWPRFSFSISTKAKAGKLSKFVSVRARINSATHKIELNPFVDNLIAILEEVEKYIEGEYEKIRERDDQPYRESRAV